LEGGAVDLHWLPPHAVSDVVLSNFIFLFKIASREEVVRWQLHLLSLAVEVVTNQGSPYQHLMEVEYLRKLQLLICQKLVFGALTSPSVLNAGMSLDLGILFFFSFVWFLEVGLVGIWIQHLSGEDFRIYSLTWHHHSIDTEE
jgi:hypothetical protein